MKNELMFRYLYYLTHANSGIIDVWKKCYDAWENFSRNVGEDEYEKALTQLAIFDKKYRMKK